MEYHVAVLCADPLFARMLELEFGMQDLRVISAASLDDGDCAELVLLDLDSAKAPPAGSYGQMIGFTRNSALLEVDTHRQCAMILHRPFEVAVLRREVLAYFRGQRFPAMPREDLSLSKRERPLTVDATRSCLLDGEREIPLTLTECKIMQCLLSHRGQPVSRETLGALIGESSANKTEVYICYLRRKTDSPSGVRLIHTVRGKGYLLK